MIKGNYWLGLIDREKDLKKEIESTVSKVVGRQFYDYTEMTTEIRNDIRIRLENYGVKHHMGIFNLEYDLDLNYDSDFVLTGFTVKFVFLNEDMW